MTNVCPKCNGHGETTRWCPTTKTSGIVQLRYAPREPVPCGCQPTSKPMKCLLVATWIVLFAFPVLAFCGAFDRFAPHVSASEREEVDRLASKYGAETEVVQWDLSRVDMLTDTHAIECDWARKWPEAVGQSLYYAILTGKEPGIVLLVRDMEAERRYVWRCQSVCAKHGIKLWVERVELGE